MLNKGTELTLMQEPYYVIRNSYLTIKILSMCGGGS